MGFTTILLIVYLVLLFMDAALLKKRRWLLFAVLTATMVLGIVILGYLWITSPM